MTAAAGAAQEVDHAPAGEQQPWSAHVHRNGTVYLVPPAPYSMPVSAADSGPALQTARRWHREPPSSAAPPAAAAQRRRPRTPSKLAPARVSASAACA